MVGRDWVRGARGDWDVGKNWVSQQKVGGGRGLGTMKRLMVGEIGMRGQGGRPWAGGGGGDLAIEVQAPYHLGPTRWLDPFRTFAARKARNVMQ